MLRVLFQILVRAASGILGVYGGGASSLFAPLSSPISTFLQLDSLIVLSKGILATTGKPASSVSNRSSLDGYLLIDWARCMALFRPRLIKHDRAKPMNRKEPTKMETMRRIVRWVEHWLE